MWSCNINIFCKIPNGFLNVSENIHRNGFNRLDFSMNHPPDSFRGFAAKNLLSTSPTNGCRNLFNQDMFVIHLINLRYKSNKAPIHSCLLQAMRVHIKCNDRCTPDRRSPNQLSPIIAPSKMFFPDIMPRIEEQRLFADTRINICRLFAFGDIAMRAGETKVLQKTLSIFNTRNNVIDVKRLSDDDLWGMAILTSSGSSSRHLSCNLSWYFRGQTQASLRFDFARLADDPFMA